MTPEEIKKEDFEETTKEQSGANEIINLDLTERARDDLIIGANALIDNLSFDEMSDVVYFFEKPYKYSEELKELGFEVTL